MGGLPESGIHNEKEEYNFGPATTSPSGMTGHQEESTCTFEDGSRKIIPIEEIACKGIGASMTVAGICSGVVIFILMILAAILGARLVKPQTA